MPAVFLRKTIDILEQMFYTYNEAERRQVSKREATSRRAESRPPIIPL